MGGAKAKSKAKAKTAGPKVPSMPPAQMPKPPEVKKEVVEKVKTKCWVVCSGKSVTSLRGIIGSGQKVAPSDFSGGSDTMKSLESKKIIELK